MNPEHTNKIKEKIKQDCIKIYIELENLILNKSPLLQYYIHKYYIEKTELTDAELDIQRMEELKKIVLGIISMVEGTGVIYTNEPSAQQI